MMFHHVCKYLQGVMRRSDRLLCTNENERILIVDQETHCRIYISKLTLKNSKFELARWIWKHWHRNYDAAYIVDLACNTLGKQSENQVNLERNASLAWDFNRLVPLPIIIMTKIVGLPCRALLDSGSLSDFISTTLVDQLQLATFELYFAYGLSRFKIKD